MCRLMCYIGDPILLAHVVLWPDRSIIKQSYDARERRGDPSLPAHVAFGNLNADGFGIGWYLDQPERDPTPCVYTSITPAWNNENLARLATKVQSPLVFAHVRAAYPGMPVSEQNCHPFQWGRYCFMHNGIIGGFSRIKRRLIEQLSDDAFNTVQSFSSDSALSFAAFLNNLPCMTKPQPPEVLLVALQKVITTIVSLQQDAGVEDLSLLNYVISDGSTTIATRFVSPSTETAATLYYAEGSALCRTQPGSHLQPGQEVAKPTGSSSSVEGEGEYFLQFGERGTRVAVVASEPITGSLSDWVAVAPNTALVITRGKGGYVNIIRSPLASAGTHSRQEEVLRCLESVGQSLDVVSRPWQELGALHQTSSFVFAPSLAATRSPSSDDLSVGSNGPTSSAAQDDGSSNLVSREDHLINAHEKAVTSLVMDEKGVLYTSSVDCSIKAWDLQNITCLATMRGHRKPILKMQVLGRFLYSTAGRHIRVWSLETFRNVHSIQTPISSGHLLSVALAADGLVIAGSQDNSLKGFRTTQQQLSHTAAAPARLPPPPRPRGMAEGERRATAEPRGSAAPDATVLGSQLSYYRRPSVQAAAASASGAIPTGPYTMETTRSVARSSGCTQRRSPGEPSPAAANHPQAPSHAFSVAEPELSTTPEDGHLSEVKSIVVCGSFVCSAGGDAVIRVWDLGTFKPLRVLKGHRGVVLTLAAVRNLLLSGGRDNVVRVWDLDAMITRHCLLGHTDDILHITAIASGPEGHRVAFNGNSYGSLKNLAAAASEVPDSCPAGPCTAKKWSDYDGDPEIKQPALAASSSADSTVRIWSTICWTCVRILHVAPAANPSMPVLCTALSNKFAVTGGQDGKLRLWNLSDLYQNILRRGVCGLAGSDDDDDDCSLSGGLPGCMSEGAEIVQGSSHQQSEAMHEASLAARAAGRLRRVNMVRLGSPPSPLQPPMESNNQLEHRLRDLVAIRTVSSDISLREECFHGAKYLAKVLESIGCEIKLYRPKEELNPVVLGRLGDVPDKPTITFYGHYDVQPAQEHDWCSNPFEMKAVDGFLYGRGTSDNKGPVLSFIYAVKELLQEGRRQSGGGGGAGGGGELPMNFAFIIEGEEENGSRGIREALEPNLRWFRNTQLIVISNSQWVGDSAPCLTCGMRGQINVSVRVAGPDRDLHSGNEGGVFNEPMSDLVKILDNLVDSRNTIRVPGFYDNTRENLVDAVMPGLEGFEQEFSVEGYQRALGVPGLTCGSSLRDLLEARWCRPSLSIVDLRMGHGMQVPSSPTSLLGQGLSTHDADADSMAALYRFGPTRYSVIPRSATGMLSIRFVPDQDPDHLVACLQDHITHQYRMLRSANHLDVQVKSVGHYWQVDTGCKLFRAAERAVEREWGVKPLHVMEGGTMPSARLLEQLLQAPALMLPLGQSSDNCHLANERIRRVNLYHGKNVFKHLIDEVAQLYERGELAS